MSEIKPMIILPPDAMSKEDQERLRENGICVVEAKEPALVKFVDPIPAVKGRTKVEDAAIQLSRRIMRAGFWTDDQSGYSTRKTIVTTFYDILVKCSPLDPNKLPEEVEKEIFDQAKADELRRLAREEAKAEREAAKAAKKK